MTNDSTFLPAYMKAEHTYMQAEPAYMQAEPAYA